MEKSTKSLKHSHLLVSVKTHMQLKVERDDVNI